MAASMSYFLGFIMLDLTFVLLNGKTLILLFQAVSPNLLRGNYFLMVAKPVVYTRIILMFDYNSTIIIMVCYKCLLSVMIIIFK